MVRVLMAIAGTALMSIPHILSAQETSFPTSEADCGAEGSTRRVSGTVETRHTQIPLFLVEVAVQGSSCGVVTDALGRFTLTGVTTSRVNLIATSIRFGVDYLALQAGSDDVLNLTFDLRLPGEPDPIGTVTPEDTRSAIRAVIQRYAPAAGDRALAIGRISAAATGMPSPPATEGPLTVILKVRPEFRWWAIGETWVDDWRSENLIAGACHSPTVVCEYEAPAILLAIGDPIPTHIDTLYIPIDTDVRFTRHCETPRFDGGVTSGLVLRLVRRHASWDVDIAPGAVPLEGRSLCAPELQTVPQLGETTNP